MKALSETIRFEGNPSGKPDLLQRKPRRTPYRLNEDRAGNHTLLNESLLENHTCVRKALSKAMTVETKTLSESVTFQRKPCEDPVGNHTFVNEGTLLHAKQISN